MAPAPPPRVRRRLQMSSRAGGTAGNGMEPSWQRGRAGPAWEWPRATLGMATSHPQLCSAQGGGSRGGEAGIGVGSWNCVRVGRQELVWGCRSRSGEAGIGVGMLELGWGGRNSDAGVGEGMQELVWGY